ncbi:MAG: WecB/TagA/CpsF family glycosyltransferase [Planctomycetia bacterium]|nr:WecB/TagA/CpsF family glycosyltransferase [Planctomycetia bacterium]
MKNVERLRVLNAPVDVLTMNKAIDCACELAKDHSNISYIVAVNPEKTYAMKESEVIRDFIEKADLVIPDGIGIVFGAKMLCNRRLERVAGADLMQEICRVSGEQNLKIFIYGAKEEVNAGAVQKLQERHSNIQIVGRANGFVKAENMNELVERINASQADILFLALGSPKQENWMNEYGPKLNVGACMGIGGTLDTIVGTVKRAPDFYQKIHLEWFYRLAKQPSRFWRQRRVFFFGFAVLAAKIKKITMCHRQENE